MGVVVGLPMTTALQFKYQNCHTCSPIFSYQSWIWLSIWFSDASISILTSKNCPVLITKCTCMHCRMTSIQLRRAIITNLSQIQEGIFTCTTRSSASAAIETGPPTGRESVKPFRDIPGPTGLYDLPYIGIAFNFKPFG